MVKCSRCDKMKPEVTKLNRICQECRKGTDSKTIPLKQQKTK